MAQDKLLQVRVTEELYERVKTASDRAALTVSDWLRCTVAQAASRGLFAPKKPREKRPSRRKS